MPPSFWGADPKNCHNNSYGPYVQHTNDDGHSTYSSREKILSVESQQDNAGLDNPTEPRVESQTWTGDMDMPYSEPDGGPKLI